MPTIAVTGGGSGGHITPVLAVAQELKKLDASTNIIYIGQTGDSLNDVPRADPNVDRFYSVRAGKLRRYHGEGWRQLLDLPTVGKNLRDAWFVCLGIVQSYQLLKKTRPDLIFTRGSFVSVPVAIAARYLGIPYVTHDSDAIPSLANRLIARCAALHAVALPKDIYPYPPDKTITVGVPISSKYHPMEQAELLAIRRRLGFSPTQQIIFMTGGGHGSLLLNEAVVAVAKQLLDRYPELAIVQLTGRMHADNINKKYNEILSDSARSRVRVEGFARNLYEYSAIADIVITRAGGTSIAEFAAQAKACVIVPNPALTGGHQTKNAQVLAAREAAVVVSEADLVKDANALQHPITELLDNPKAAHALAERLHAIAQPDSARTLGVVLLEQVSKARAVPSSIGKSAN